MFLLRRCSTDILLYFTGLENHIRNGGRDRTALGESVVSICSNIIFRCEKTKIGKAPTIICQR